MYMTLKIYAALCHFLVTQPELNESIVDILLFKICAISTYLRNSVQCGSGLLKCEVQQTPMLILATSI